MTSKRLISVYTNNNVQNVYREMQNVYVKCKMKTPRVKILDGKMEILFAAERDKRASYLDFVTRRIRASVPATTAN